MTKTNKYKPYYTVLYPFKQNFKPISVEGIMKVYIPTFFLSLV